MLYPLTQQGFKAEFGSLLDENLRLLKKLREANVEVKELRRGAVALSAGNSEDAKPIVSINDFVDFKWENQRLKDLLKKQSVDLKELQRLVGSPEEGEGAKIEKEEDDGSLQRRLEHLRDEAGGSNYGEVEKLRLQNQKLNEELGKYRQTDSSQHGLQVSRSANVIVRILHNPT